jgi:hypothetical protein
MMEMTKLKKTLLLFISFGYIFLLTSCLREDPGVLESGQKEFLVANFNGLEMGNAFVIDVREGNEFKVLATGDVRNLEDLKVYKSGSTLNIEYRNRRIRKHQTYISIIMPKLVNINFSGASDAVISGFGNTAHTEIELSGASKAEIDMQSQNFSIELSGASNLTVSGNSTSNCKIELSDASKFNGFSLPATYIEVDASGASTAYVYAIEQLDVTASGASSVFYRGNPSVSADLSGASCLKRD